MTEQDSCSRPQIVGISLFVVVVVFVEDLFAFNHLNRIGMGLHFIIVPVVSLFLFVPFPFKNKNRQSSNIYIYILKMNLSCNMVAMNVIGFASKLIRM